jgi:flagellar assembly protein FliH
MCDMSAETRKNWGTIFMGTERELNLDQLSSVAPLGGAFWKQDQDAAYLLRVQQRAAAQAQAILARAGRERTALLEAARSETARMREEAEHAREEAERQSAAQLAESAALKAGAAQLHEEARRLHAGAEAAGHAAGVERAQAELEHFRAVMGESVGAVLSAVHDQCGRIFALWKEDLCALLLTCVEKGTGLALERDRARLLEELFLGAVKLFEAHSAVLVRVQPDDEAAVADMCAAAKERSPGLAAWSVQGDPELGPGDLVLEGAHSRVESRIEERRRAVDAALRHIMLPGLPEEEKSREDLARTHAEAVARMLELAPKRTLAPAESAVASNAESVETPYPEADNAAPEPVGTEKIEDMRAASQTPEGPMPPPAPQVDLSRVWERPSAAESTLLNVADATDAVDAVLAEGGFLPRAGEA